MIPGQTAIKCLYAQNGAVNPRRSPLVSHRMCCCELLAYTLGVLFIPHQYVYPIQRTHKLPFSYNSL